MGRRFCYVLVYRENLPVKLDIRKTVIFRNYYILFLLLFSSYEIVCRKVDRKFYVYLM